jgi:Flp pilus assembly pilin Flp
MKRHIGSFLRSDQGATVIEYGLIASLVIVVIIAALQNLGSAVLVSLFDKIGAAF